MCKIYITFLVWFVAILATAQDKTNYGTCKYQEAPTYIINSDNVIFENCNIHRETETDPKTAKIYDEGLALDSTSVYLIGIKMDAIPVKFEIILRANPYYQTELVWKNRDYVFFNDKKIVKLDNGVFKNLNFGYYQSGNSIYYLDIKIENADPATFIASTEFSYDKNAVYHNGVQVFINGKAMKPLNSEFVKDDRSVYQYNYGAPDQFTVIDSIKIENAVGVKNSNYAVLNNILYFGSRKTFDLSEKKEEVSYSSTHFIKFKTFAIYHHYLISTLDIKTLKTSEYTEVFSDKNGFYKISEDTDLNNFKYNLDKQILIFEKTNKTPDLPPVIYFKEDLTLKIVEDQLFLELGLFLTKDNLKNSELQLDSNLQLVSILKGYRKGCSQDRESNSNTYILKNSKGFWSIYKTSTKTTIDFVGKNYQF